MSTLEKALTPSEQSILEVVKFSIVADHRREFPHYKTGEITLETAGSFRSVKNLTWEHYHTGEVVVSPRQAKVGTGHSTGNDNDVHRLLITPEQDQLITIKDASNSGTSIDKYYVSDYVYGVCGRLVHHIDAGKDYKLWDKQVRSYAKLIEATKVLDKSLLALTEQETNINNIIDLMPRTSTQNEGDVASSLLNTQKMLTNNIKRDIYHKSVNVFAELVVYREPTSGELYPTTEVEEHNIPTDDLAISDMYYDYNEYKFKSINESINDIRKWIKS